MSLKSKRQTGAIILILLISLGLYLSFGLYHISKFETADEHYWIYDSTAGRIHDYWKAIATKNWLGTRINDKPGVMLAYVSGIGIFFEDGLNKRPDDSPDYQSAFSSVETEKINRAFRVPLLIFNGLFSLFIFWAVKRLTKNKWLALTATTLILLNPVIIGVSQIINPDALLWVFSFSALISLLNYLEYGKKIDAFLCSILFGFALLSKYSAVIFIPFFFIIVLLYLLQEKEQGDLAKKVKRHMPAYLLILAGSFAVFAILMPAVIISPSFFYYGTIGFKGMAPIFWSVIGVDLLLFLEAHFLGARYSFLLSRYVNLVFPYLRRLLFFVVAFITGLVLINWSIGDNFLLIKGMNFDAGHDYPFRRQDFFDKLFLEIYPLVFSLTPLALLSLIALWIKGVFGKLRYPLLVFISSSFIVVFYAAVLKQDLLVNIRYSVMLYPILMLLAAFSFDEFLLSRMKNSHRFVVVLLVIVVSSTSLWLIKPYYFNYTNDLLPKDKIITGAWGYGGYEAAQVLNALPDSKNLNVWSDYWGVCYFFDGTCVQATGYDNFTQKAQDKKIDYYVMTRRGEMSNVKTWNKIGKKSLGKAVWELNIDDRPKNFIRIYAAN
ncbi:MAG: glycosyltransferase family 39 protein [Parcubacteria group bacterium]|jgi:4-amino-4-deoxy-L-arabinose transferase-like glycosyltransferase